MERKPTKADMCGCGCGAPLDKNDPCGPQFMVRDGKQVFVNPDCYFEAISEEIDKHPIGGLGICGPVRVGISEE